MAVSDIGDNLKEQFKTTWGRLRESDAYQQLAERYGSLSPTGQKLSIVGAIFLAFLLVMAVPYSFYSGSSTALEDFESKRNLVRELFRSNREAASLPLAPPPVTAQELSNMAHQALNGARLQAEQILAVTEMNASVAGVPKSIDQNGVQVALSKLNLQQLVSIGNDLQNLPGAGTARMTGLEIKPNASDAKYYDVTYKIVAFSAKPDIAPKGTSAKGKKK